MKYSFTIFLSFLLAPLTFYGQAGTPGGTQPLPQDSKEKGISGRVVDAQSSQPLDYATVSVYQLPDSLLVGGAVTDLDGIFQIDVKPGTYFLKAEFISYRATFAEKITLTKKEPFQNVGTISLQPDAEILAEVEVRAQKSQTTLALDKKVFNVGKDLANKGGNAADLLDNVPSVTVDLEGNVNLRGSGNVRILVNGKPSGLVGFSNSNGLRQIPATLIDRIEVITNPSARYEAEGMAGIINIILKKEEQRGFNGSVEGTVGYPDNYGVSANVNYRTDRLNFFGTYGLFYRQSPGEGLQYQEFYRNDTTFITDQTRDRLRGGLSNSFRFGADYYFNPKNILTGALTYRISNEDNFSTIEYRDFLNSLDNPTGVTERTDEEFEREPNLEGALTYRREFEEKGREFTADIRYQDNLETEGSDLRETFFTPNGIATGEAPLIQRSNNTEGEKQLIAQFDYVHPWKEDGKWEAGLRASFRDISNSFLVEELQGGSYVPLAGLDNDFNYLENIVAIYGIIGDKINNFSYQVGVRGEYTDIRTELVKTGESNPRDYLNLFPSAHITYDLPNQNAVQLSYSRRINRPNFWSLNPFFTFSDARNFWAGNPDLDPEFTHSMELGHMKYWDRASMTTSLYYRNTEGIIQRIRTIDTLTGNTITIPYNLSNENAFGIESNFTFDPFKWWKLDGNFNFFRSIIDGGNVDQTLASDTYGWFVRLNSKMTLWDQVDFQTRVRYNAPIQTPQGRRLAFYTIDLGLSKDVLKERGTLTLSVQDLLNSRRRRYITEGNEFYTEGDWQWRARQILLTFSYRIKQNK
jgi:ferric enterobactin receptor